MRHRVEMDDRRVESAALAGEVFTRADALAAGFTSRQIETFLLRGEWTALRAGIYVSGAAAADPTDLTLRTQAALLRLGRDAAASHQTAARLRRMALLGPRVAGVDISRPAAEDRTPAKLPGVRALRSGLPDSHVMVFEGIRQTVPPRTVLDVARTSSFRAGVVTADSALHLGLTTVQEMRDVAADCRHWPGKRRALEVVEFATPLAESALESVSRVTFRDHGLPMHRLQVVLSDADGEIGRVDFFWEEYGVVGEADGRVKYGNDERTDALWAEKLRQERLEDAGFIVVRWTWSEIFNDPFVVVARIRRAFARAEARRRTG